MHKTRWTIEVVPGDTDKLIRICSNGGTNIPDKVYITHLEDTDYAIVIDCAKRLQKHGISAVPHLGVRNLPSSVDIWSLTEQLKESGIKEMLLLGGNAKKPLGKYTQVLDILKTGAFDADFERLHFAGFPEDHPDVKDMDLMYKALTDKISYATDKGITARVVSQFCFDSDIIIGYLKKLQPLQKSVEKYVGLSAPVSIPKLIKFSLMCGVGNSIKFLDKNVSNLSGLASGIFGQYDSSKLIEQVLRSGENMQGFHVFAFGNYQKAFDAFQGNDALLVRK